MRTKERAFSRNAKAGVAVFCAAAACVIMIAAGGCGDENLVFPGGTPAATGTAPTQTTVGTATPSPEGTPSPTTPTPRTTPITPTCSQNLQPCNILRPCCTGQCLPAPLSVCLG